MKKTMMAMTMMFALGCFAQTSSSGSGNPSTGTSGGSSGQAGSASSGSSGSMGSDQSGTMSRPNSDSMSDSGMKGDKTLKGCVQSQNGTYMLQEKHGKMAMLSGSDLSSHVGQMVKVHGMWQSSAMSSGSANSGSMSSGSMSSGSGSMSPSASNSGTGDSSGMTASGSSADSHNGMSKDSMNSDMSGKMDHSGQSFMVDKVEMMSGQCKMDKDMH